MVTAQDIRDVIFSKSLGGYKTAEVDAFLDACADTVESLTATNEENERKMNVLAESIMDYRKREDSIHTALVSAQRMSETIIAEAHEKAAEIVAAAEVEAGKARETAEAAIAEELEELKRIRNEVATFKSRLMAAYREHLTLIGVLDGDQEDDSPSVETAPAQEETPVAVVDAPSQDAMDAPEIETSGLDFSAFALDEDDE